MTDNLSNESSNCRAFLADVAGTKSRCATILSMRSNTQTSGCPRRNIDQGRNLMSPQEAKLELQRQAVRLGHVGEKGRGLLGGDL
jgi:hypothetical protein